MEHLKLMACERERDRGGSLLCIKSEATPVILASAGMITGKIADGRRKREAEGPESGGKSQSRGIKQNRAVEHGVGQPRRLPGVVEMKGSATSKVPQISTIS